MPRRPSDSRRLRRRAVALTGSAALAGAVLVPVAAATPASAGPPAPTPAPAACAPGHSGFPHASARITGFSDAYDKKVLGGVPVGGLSALALDHGRLLALSDRSALFSAAVTGPASIDARGATVQKLVKNGQPLDSEGLAVETNGTRLATSETEPSINRFSPSGTYLGSLPVPKIFRVAPRGNGVSNGTFEGLTLAGGDLSTMNEVPLTGDNGYTRLLTYRSTGHGGWEPEHDQFPYRPDPGLGVPEIQAVPGTSYFLVLERGYTPGVGNTVRLYLANVEPATAIDDPELPISQTGFSRDIDKVLIADLATCPSLGATAKGPQVNPLLDNIEGMVITSRRGNRLKVVLVSDDNDNPTQTTRLYGLDVSVDLPPQG